MRTRIIIATNCCYNCKFKGDDFTDGTFHCKYQDEHLDEEVRECPDYEMKDFEDEKW